MELPESLQPWRQWLEWFDPQLVPSLGALLSCISPLLGPFKGVHLGGVPEPDGLGNLHRRGSYERLLSSEWLLADEFADEFLRRASSGEHLFLAPQYRARQASRLIVVLFDAGPLQLGGARLVHLALMILLARRAAENGAQFRWGVLQHKPELFELHSAVQLRGLLKARTYATVTEAHWQDWQQALAEHPEQASEFWLVGQRLPQVPGSRGLRLVQIQQGLFGEGLELRMQASHAVPVVLPAPDEAAGRRLLSGQFEKVVALEAHMTTAARISLTAAPLISSTGSHVAVRLLDEAGLMIFSVPRPGQRKPAKSKRQLWSREAAPLGLALDGRQACALLSAGERLCFWHLPGMESVARPPREELLIPAGTATLLRAIRLKMARHTRLFVLTSDRTLAYWATAGAEQPPATGTTHYLDRDVLGMQQIDDWTLVYARRHAGQLSVCYATLGYTRHQPFALGDGTDASAVLFGDLQRWRRGFGACAVQHGQGTSETWTLFTPSSHPQPQARLELPPNCKAIGLFHDVQRGQFALVVKTGGGKNILLVSPEKTESLHASPSRILKISFCPASGSLALVTETRGLLVLDVATRSVRMQLQTAHKDLADE
ncbi:hypothetical protein [Pseudomonas sp. COR18]|uniref:hypothetical protein n=1 Tax=Pseudomonas sp. COR18 TaxID=3399680 RepID=UPI003B0002A3